MAIKTFTTGEVLTAADTNTYLANSGLVYIASATMAAGSTTTPTSLNSVFSAEFDNYKIILNTNGNGTAAFYEFRLRASGTPPAAGYYGNSITMTSNATTVQGNGQANAAFFTLGAQQSGTDRTHAEIEVFDPFVTQMTSMRMSASTYFSGFAYNYQGQAQHNLATSYNGFAISIAAGTFSGTVTVYGYRKA